MGLTIMRRIKFCAGHRLYKHGGKCEHFHGHNYVADIFVTGDEVDSVGRVIDFADLKTRVKGWIDQHWDHSFLVYEGDENAKQALSMVQPSRMYVLPYNPTPKTWLDIFWSDVSAGARRNGGSGNSSADLGDG